MKHILKAIAIVLLSFFFSFLFLGVGCILNLLDKETSNLIMGFISNLVSLIPLGDILTEVLNSLAFPQSFIGLSIEIIANTFLEAIFLGSIIYIGDLFFRTKILIQILMIFVSSLVWNFLTTLPLPAFLPADCIICIMAITAAILLSVFVFNKKGKFVRKLIASILIIIGNSLIAVILCCYLNLVAYWMLNPGIVMQSMSPLEFSVISFNAALAVGGAALLNHFNECLCK